MLLTPFIYKIFTRYFSPYHSFGDVLFFFKGGSKKNDKFFKICFYYDSWYLWFLGIVHLIVNLSFHEFV
ncbi:MAG: hypothetical protein COV35_04645 [Alphaproteobacteria bacterium CG11_big_fil_rev_8_21_14_0_20_39_49]|nr:MAG: hypothetical protein COV35_04645 [Alphaproteobacteria bacterium CG11_big_fil_rev_8_21_14_0_20_39_49]